MVWFYVIKTCKSIKSWCYNRLDMYAPFDISETLSVRFYIRVLILWAGGIYPIFVYKIYLNTSDESEPCLQVKTNAKMSS